MNSAKPRIILASESPRRAMLLRSLGLEFAVVPSNIDERSVKLKDPKSCVKRLATLKAESVAGRVKEGMVIGADTTVVIGGKMVGKPKDEREASKMLRLLSGKTHTVMTGVCVLNAKTGERRVVAVSTKVRFNRLSREMIKRYVGTGEPMGKAGAYAIQSSGAVLIDRIYGDYNNVVGLPLSALTKILERMGAQRHGSTA